MIGAPSDCVCGHPQIDHAHRRMSTGMNTGPCTHFSCRCYFYAKKPR